MNAKTYYMVLADGSRWSIQAGDEQALAVVSRLREVMQLSGGQGPSSRLLVRVDGRGGVLDRCGDEVVCVLPEAKDDDGLYVQLMQLSMVVAREAQTRGGVLLHGGLAEWKGHGVVLAAPGGTGKTTASGRLPSPWRSLCDDMTLVVRDAQGHYWAHPWPTWSCFLWGGSGGSWDVEDAVPLKGIFFLSRADEDRVERVGSGQGVSLLVECAQQASQLMTRGLSKEEKRALQLERFNNLCALTRTIPSHLLHISLTGTFWLEMERMLLGRKGVVP